MRGKSKIQSIMEKKETKKRLFSDLEKEDVLLNKKKCLYKMNYHIDFMDKMYNKIQKGVRFYQVISSVYGRPGL